MYEDSWYSYVPESHSKRDDASKHQRRESLLKQQDVRPFLLLTGSLLIRQAGKQSDIRAVGAYHGAF